MIPYSSTAFAMQTIPGVLLSMGVLLWYATYVGQRPAAWLDVALGGGVVALIAGRLQHAAFEWDYFSTYPGDLLDVWYGGFGWHTMLLGGIVAAAAIARWRGVAFGHFADGVALVLPLVIIATWWACRSAGCAVGVDASDTMSPWLNGYLPDAFGDVERRVELQVLGATLSGGLFSLMAWLTWAGHIAGRRLWVVLMLVGAMMVVLGFWRGDEAATWGGLRMDQWLDLLVMGVGFGGYWATRPQLAYNRTITGQH